MNAASNFSDLKQMIERGYDKVAHEYACLEGEIKWPRMRWLNKLLNRLEPGSSVLDLGCGSGDPADIEISMEHKVTGVDISQTQINLARQNVPTGNFIHGDAGSMEFPVASFDAVVSFYSMDLIPREEHETILRRIYQWLRVGGYLLISIEAGDYDNVKGQWLGVPMFISCFDPERMKQMVKEVGFELLETDIETQVEQRKDIPYLWLLGLKK
jgi:ubiquinone/menaquinone biosynthesis C-methylase UbiE